jgi:hypothetical protein
MGLDMYLYSSTKGEIGYWRKANHIHGFFESSLSKCDNCRDNVVSFDTLKELLERCIRVRDSLKKSRKMTVTGEDYSYDRFLDTDVALDLLPPFAGFFFGDYEITNYYLKTIEYTINILTTAISAKEKGERFYYHPWW